MHDFRKIEALLRLLDLLGECSQQMKYMFKVIPFVKFLHVSMHNYSVCVKSAILCTSGLRIDSYFFTFSTVIPTSYTVE